MGTVNDVLTRARAQIGYNGGGTSDNPVTSFGAWFGVQTQWCAEFASWCLYNSGVAPLGRWAKGEDYCPAWVTAYQQAGRWSQTPHPGDLVFYSWNRNGVADHVGLVESVNSDGTITTIEGNTDDPAMWQYLSGNCCRRKVRNTFYVMGYGRPAYSATETTQSAAAVPLPPAQEEDVPLTAAEKDEIATLTCAKLVAALKQGGVLGDVGTAIRVLTPVIGQATAAANAGLTRTAQVQAAVAKLPLTAAPAAASDIAAVTAAAKAGAAAGAAGAIDQLTVTVGRHQA